jgi:urease accessory protein
VSGPTAPLDPFVLPVPAEIARYAAEPPQLGTGQPGKVGVLCLELAPVDGVTRLVRSFSRVPLRVLRALSCDPHRPDQAFVFITSVSGGILQGDRLSIEVVARPHSFAHVTTQAMTKVYRMTHGYAHQSVRLRAEAGSYLEYLPDPTIPYRNARYYQELTLTRETGATLIAAETLLPGRIASGETFGFDVVCFATRGYDHAGRLSFQDTLLLRPRETDPRSRGLLGGHDIVANMFVLTDAVANTDLVAAIPTWAGRDRETFLTATALPNDAGMLVRVLSTTPSGAQAAIDTAWAIVRKRILGSELPPVRKY